MITSNLVVNYLDAEENTGHTMLSGNGRHYWERIFKLYLFFNARAEAELTKTYCTVSFPFYLGHWSSNKVGCQCCLDLTQMFMIITVIIIFINIILIFITITVILILIIIVKTNLSIIISIITPIIILIWSLSYRSASQMWFSRLSPGSDIQTLHLTPSSIQYSTGDKNHLFNWVSRN